MTKYSYAQLEELWDSNGGNKAVAPLAAAVAMAESGGESTAQNINSNGSVDRGLWQINSVHGSQSTFDVPGNVKAAISISNNGTNWSPWVTYTSGAYKKFLQGNVPPSTATLDSATSPAGIGSGILSFPTDILNFFGSADSFITKLLWLVNPASWVRIGSFFAGGLLLLMGIWVLIKVGSDDPLIKAPSAIPIPVPV